MGGTVMHDFQELSHFEEPYTEGAILCLGRSSNKSKTPSSYTGRILPVLYSKSYLVIAGAGVHDQCTTNWLL